MRNWADRSSFCPSPTLGGGSAILDSLKRAIDQIFGSVIQPIVDWILRQSWIVRLLCLLVITLAAFTWWKPQTVLGTAQEASFYWRSWRGEANVIPVPKGAQHSLALAMRRIAPSVEADLSAKLDQSPLTSWSASQSVLALRLDGQEIPDKDAYLVFVNGRRAAPDCFCWTELEEQPKSEAAAHISGWVMAAFAEIGDSHFRFRSRLYSPATECRRLVGHVPRIRRVAI